MVVLHVVYHTGNGVTLPASLANITILDGVNLTFRASSGLVMVSRYRSFRRRTERCDVDGPAYSLHYRLLNKLKTTKK